MKTPKPNETPKSALTFIGTSPDGHLREAIKDALKKAADASGDTNMPWKVERIGGDRLELGSVSVMIRINPDAPEGPPGKQPKLPDPPPNQ